MSSYLNIYLVPKENKTKYSESGTTEEISFPKEPLCLYSFGRNHPVYQQYSEYIHVFNEYKELTIDIARSIVEDCRSEINTVENDLRDYTEILSNCKVPNQNLVDDILYCKRDLRELNNILSTLVSLMTLVEEISHSDFSKVLVSIG